MQFEAKLACLLLSIQSVCSMEQNFRHLNFSDDYGDVEGLTEEDLVNAAMQASMNVQDKEEEKRMQKLQEQQRKANILQCPQNVKLVVDQCFCGVREGHRIAEIEVWCKPDQYCFVDQQAFPKTDCYKHKHCTKSSLQGPDDNGDLNSTCLYGSLHQEAEPGFYYSKEGNLLRGDQYECERNKFVTRECMCGGNCQAGSVCVEKEKTPWPRNRDQCFQFCDRDKITHADGDDSDCICRSRYIPGFKESHIKFCEGEETCVYDRDSQATKCIPQQAKIEVENEEEDEDENGWEKTGEYDNWDN